MLLTTNNDDIVCAWCEHEIIPGDLSRVEILTMDDILKDVYHTSCFEHLELLSDYFNNKEYLNK